MNWKNGQTGYIYFYEDEDRMNILRQIGRERCIGIIKKDIWNQFKEEINVTIIERNTG